MPSTLAGTAPEKKRVDEWLLDKVRAGHNLTGYLNLYLFYQQDAPTDPATLLDTVRDLLVAGIIESPEPDDVTGLRLPGRQVLETVIGELLVDQWRAVGGLLRVKRCATQCASLLAEYAARAVEIDAAAALYTAVAAALPHVERAAGHRAALGALERTDVYGHRIGCAQLVRTIASMADFAGTADELVDTAVAVLT